MGSEMCIRDRYEGRKGRKRRKDGGKEKKRTREGGSGWAEKQYISASAVSEAGSC